MTHKTSIIFSGTVWLLVGLFLLTIGLNLLVDGAKPEVFASSHYPLLDSFGPLFGSLENGAIALIAFALFIGYFKGRMVLGKTASKTVKRLKSMDAPLSFLQVYTPKYCLLLAFMMSLGMLIKYLGIANDVRGVIDVAVGSALINGSVSYYRAAFA